MAATTRSEAVSKLKILLGETAATSQQRSESIEDFRGALVAMRDAIDHAIACVDADIAERKS